MIDPLRLRALLLALLLPAASVEAQSSDGFPCAETLVKAGLSEPSVGDADPPYPVLKSQPGEPPRGADPINPQERLGEEEPLLLRSAPGQDTQPYLSCALIIITFLNTENQTTLNLRGPDDQSDRQRLPVLVVGLADSRREADGDFDRWRENRYNISAILDSFDSTGRRKIRPSDFGNLRWFEDPDWTDQSVRPIDAAAAGDEVRDFLESHGGTFETILVMCGDGPCHKVLASFEGSAAADGDALSELTTEGATNGRVPEAVEPDVPTGEENTRAIKEAVPQSLSGPEADAGGITPPTPVDDPQELLYPYGADFTYVSSDGTQTTDPFPDIDRLECLLYGVSTDLFVDPAPECHGQGFDELSARNALLGIGDQGQILVIAGAQNSRVEQLEVTLPNGVGSLCRLNAQYQAEGGDTVSVALNPRGGSEPATFEADLSDPPKRTDDGLVRIEIIPEDAGSCGGAGRIAEAESARTLTLPLVGVAPRNTAVLNVLVARQTDLANDLQLDDSQSAQFILSSINAIRSAHTQLSVLEGDVIWALTASRVIALEDGGDVNVLAQLSPNQMRNGDGSAFSGLTLGTAADLATQNSRVTPDTLLTLLESAAQQASDTWGVSTLYVNLIAPVASRPASGLQDPCTDPLYRVLSDDLAALDDHDVRVSVYPLVRLRADDAIDVSHLTPLDPDALSPTVPSGLYSCASFDGQFRVNPYYLEHWRDPVEFGARYGTSLASALADDLYLANQREPN